jgi:pachytene checkpoint protein 2
MTDDSDNCVVLKPIRLPCDDLERDCRHLALPKSHGKRLGRLALLYVKAQVNSVRRSPLNGVLLFAGVPGSGKTLTAGVFAQRVADKYREIAGGDTFLFRIFMPDLLSEFLGRSGRAVCQLFEAITFSAERRPTIVVADELESICISRARLTSSDPSDVVRVVNELLRQIDLLRGRPNFLLIGTTNVTALVDSALIDRADFVFKFENPDAQAAAKILRHASQDAHFFGVEAADNEIDRAADLLCNHDTAAANRPSGRLLSKLPLLTFVDGGGERLTAEMLVATARRRMAAGEV